MNKALFIDLDGTIRETISGDKFINNPQDQQLISGVEEAIKRYENYLIFGITNQGGVAYGFKSIKDTIIEQQITLDLVPQMRLILFCPDKEGKELYMVSRDNRGVKIDFEAQSKPCPEAEYFGEESYPLAIPDYDSFRKPGIGMIQYLLDTFTINLEESLMVGDLESDRECAVKAGCEFMWADEWRKS